jgi:hypothetical protein
MSSSNSSNRGGRGLGRGRIGGGRGRGRRGLGPGGKCECTNPDCGKTITHQIGKPCYRQKCPECGSPMVRED